MKTLINKSNPQIRITAPEIERRKAMFYQDEHYCLIIKGLPWLDADDWTLVEEEPAEGIKGNLEEIPSNVDLEKEIEKAQEHYFALKDKGFSLDSMDVSVLARHFYELGAEWQKEQKPVEWSERDEDMLNRCISSIDEAKENRYAYNETDGDTSYDEEIKWLKSLHPQPKKELSIEKAIKWLDDTFYFLDNSSGRGRNCEITTHDFDSLEEMYDSFRKAVIVDSEPHWKPSEEQMGALWEIYQGGEAQAPIASLYEDLKKL